MPTWTDLEPLWADLLAWLPRVAVASAILFLGWALGRVVERGVVAAMQRGRFAPTHQTFFANVARWVVWAFGATLALDAVGLGGVATGLLAGGGATAIVLGFAFREIGENLLAGVFLAFSRPFELGDWVQSGDVEGAVVDLDLRTVHVRTIDGKDIWIPNSQVINQPFVNYTLDGLRRPSFTVGLDYGDDAADACTRIEAAIASVPDVLPEPPPMAIAVALDGAWVTLSISFWMDTKRADRPMQRVVSDVIDRTRRTLRDGGFTLSNDTTTAVALHPSSDVAVRLPPAT